MSRVNTPPSEGSALPEAADPGPRPRVLLVDDAEDKRIVLRRMLADLELDLVEVSDGAGAIGACAREHFALILLDVQMPDMDGFTVAQRLADLELVRGAPIIFVTGLSFDSVSRGRGYSAGAVDYLFYPPDPHILRSKVQVLLELYRARRQLQEQNQQLQREVAERKRLEEVALYQATHDPLTGRANRRLLMSRLDRLLSRADRRKTSFALICLDMDGFKPINDRYGHQAGDALLLDFGERLAREVRDVDTVARLGGDEFAVLLDEPISAEEAFARMQALHAGAFGRYTLTPTGQDQPVTVTVGCSAGLALFPEDGTDLDTLMRNADAALYRAKRAGKNRCVRFSAPDPAGAD